MSDYSELEIGSDKHFGARKMIIKDSVLTSKEYKDLLKEYNELKTKYDLLYKKWYQDSGQSYKDSESIRSELYSDNHGR